MKKSVRFFGSTTLRAAISWLLVLVMVVGFFPFGFVRKASAANESMTPDTREMWEIALDEGYSHFDTIDLCGGNSHLQGICVDDKMEYMYFSYTSALAKVDMKTGKVVGSVGGFGQGSFGTAGGAHLGCLAYYDGKIYGSLEYKEPGKKFFVAVFDENAITSVGMDVKQMETGVNGILLYEPTSDFRNPLNDTVSGSDGFAVNEENAGHKYACSGIDGVTFGTMPGDTSGKIYMFVAYGVYGGSNWSNRYDNNYNVLQVYDPEQFNGPEDTVLRRFTYERGLANTYEESEILRADDTLYVWTGNTSYGAQNIEYDRDTKDIVLYTYGNTKGWPGKTMYVVDGSKTPVEKEIEVGQSNTASDAAVRAAAIAKAETYKENGAYPTGKHGVLKCICGNNCQEKVWSDTGISAMICGGAAPASATTGIASIGNGYYYIADGATTASLYRRNANYGFERVVVAPKPVELLNYSMDAADLYTDPTGNTRMKNQTAEGHDAMVKGTSADKGATGDSKGALAFNGWNSPAEPDRLYLDDSTIAYLNDEISTSYSYSFWAKMAQGANTDGNFIPFIGFYRSDGTCAGVYETRWRDKLKYVINGIGDAAAGSPGDSGAYLIDGATAVPGDEKWHFFTTTEADGAGVVYMDGVKQCTYTVAANHLTADPITYFEVGGGMAKLWYDMNNRGRLIGAIDDITIYKGYLSAEEVQAAYNAKKNSIDATATVTGGVTVSPAEAGTGFTPAYPVFDLTGNEGGTLAVTADKAVSGITGLTAADVTISGQSITFHNAFLSSRACGAYSLTVNYFDGTKGTMKLTITNTDATNPVPVLCYTLGRNDVDGSTVKDSSAYQVNAYTTTATFGNSHNGVKQGALTFDGFHLAQPTYVKLSDQNAAWLNSVLQRGYTINFWAKASIENGNKMTMLGFYAADARPLGVVETYDCDGGDNTLQADGKMTVQLDTATTGKVSENARAADASKTTSWYMYTATYDQATKTNKLYVNGQAVASKAVTAEILGNIDQFFIGTQYKKYYSTDATQDWTTRGGFKGEMDDVSVYPVALTAAQVSALYGTGPSTPAANAKPIVHYTMDANTLNGDGTVADSSAYGNNGCYQNLTVVPGVDGKNGGALHFDGNATQLSRLWMGQNGIDALNDSVDNQITVSFWFKSDDTNVNNTFTGFWTPILGLYTTKTANGTPGRFLLTAEFRSPGVVMEMNNYPDNTWPTDIRSKTGSNLSDGKWHHIVMTVDGEKTEGGLTGGTSQYRRFYIDGNVVPQERAAYLSSNLLGNIENFEIGGEPYKCWSDTNIRGRVTGSIDDVKIYNVPFEQTDVAREYAAKTSTSEKLYLPATSFTVDIAKSSDVTVAVHNAQNLVSISGLEAAEYSFNGTEVTISGEALCALGLGDHMLTLGFLNGSKIIKVSVIDSRAYFNPNVLVFEKSNPAATDVTFKTNVSFTVSPTSVTAEGMTKDDYTMNGTSIIIKKEYLMKQQPGAVFFTVTAANGDQRTGIIHVTSVAPTANQPYPILYYKMDGSDIVTSGTKTMLTEHSGNGIDAVLENVTATANQNGAAGRALFFNGYQDAQLQKVYLESEGLDYLNRVIDNTATFSYWFSTDRISSNFMPVMGLFGEGGRPGMMAQFRTSGGERPGAGQTTAPALVNTPVNVTMPNIYYIKSATPVTMNKVWHHMVTVYDGNSQTATVYLDGQQVVAGGAATGTLDHVQDFVIGGMLNQYYSYTMNTTAETGKSVSLNGYYYGNLDEVKVYNVALTAENVSALYNMGVASNLPVDITGMGLGVTDDSGDALIQDSTTQAYTLVKVTRLSGCKQVAVENAAVTTGPDGKISVQLPTAEAGQPENNNQTVIVTLTDLTGAPKAAVHVELVDQNGSARQGTSDAAGQVRFAAAKVLTGMKVTTVPATVQYTQGTAALDLTGGMITLSYDDQSSETIAITQDMVSGFNSATIGRNVITVTYKGYTDTFYVVITTQTSGGGGGGGTSRYAVTVTDGKGGSVRANNTTVAAGSSVVVTVDADEGYVFKSISITDNAGNKVPYTVSGNRYTFIMPRSKVTVTAAFQADETKCDGGSDCLAYDFGDVNANHWFHGAVDYVLEHGMMASVSAEQFAPSMTTSRSMIVTILYSMEKKPAASGNDFNDVDGGAWYANAVNWAADQGIVGGYGNGRFGPNDPITREQLAAILMNYAKQKGYDVSDRGDLSKFSDADQVSDWAKDALSWANYNGLISGKGNGIVDAKGQATRAETAAILTAFCQLFAG